MSLDLMTLVADVLGRAPEWVNSDLAAKNLVIRRRAEETMASMITAALRERDQNGEHKGEPTG